MKTKLLVAAVLAGVFASAQPAFAVTPITVNFKNSTDTATDGTDGVPRDFTASNGMTVTAQAWSLNPSTGVVSQAYLGWYTHGVGVTNNTEGNGQSNSTHTIDNVGQYDFITLTFSQNVQILTDSVYPFDVTVNGRTDYDIDQWISFSDVYSPTKSITDPNVWANMVLHGTEVTGSAPTQQYYTANVNPGMNSGNIWIIGADKFNSKDLDDGFKLAGLTFQLPVPEPSSWAMMISGFGVAGGALRRRSRKTGAALTA